MRKWVRVMVPGVLALVAVGCAGGGGGMKAFTPNESEKQTATAVATNTAGLTDLKDGASAEQGQAKVAMIGLGAQQAFSNQQGRNEGTAKAALQTIGASLTADDPCITRTETRITYANCVSGGTTTNGFIDMAGDTFTIDLTATSSGDAVATSEYEGAITVTATSIDGHFRYKVDSRQGASYMKYDIRTTYDAIVLADGCPVGGVLLVDGTMDVNFEGLGGGSDSAAVEVTFGPTCGQMSMVGGS